MTYNNNENTKKRKKEGEEEYFIVFTHLQKHLYNYCNKRVLRNTRCIFNYWQQLLKLNNYLHVEVHV